MLLNGLGEWLEVAAFRPQRKQRQFFCLAECFQIRIVFQKFCKRMIEKRAGNATEIGQRQVVLTETDLLENTIYLRTPYRGVGEHARVNLGPLFWAGTAQRFLPGRRGQDGERR